MYLIPPASTLIINIQVDSLAVLSGAPAEECIWLVDNSARTEGKGAPVLRSVASPGQRVRWTLTSVDLQAPAWLQRIMFVDRHHERTLHALGEGDAIADEPAWNLPARAMSWEGFVPPSAIAGTPYPYGIHLSFGNEVGIPYVLSGCEIEVLSEEASVMPALSGSTWANQAYSMSGGVL
jgi:hypothetical protein